MEAAISKQQPMRPALVEVVDSANVREVILDRATADIATIKGEIGEGFSSELTIAQSLGATNQQVGLLTQEVDDSSEAIVALEAFMNRFRVGRSEPVEIAAEGSHSSSITFNTPFADTADICVFMCCVAGDEILTHLDCFLISATYSGFSYSIQNTDADSHTVALGFVAIQVN